MNFIRRLLNVFIPRVKTNNNSIKIDQEFEWCIIGNIVDRHFHGTEKKINIGTKYFSPNTKVYCLPKYYGVAHESIEVLGKKRKSRKLICITIQTKRIKNFRIVKVYKPIVIGYIRENSYYDSWKKEGSKSSELENLTRYLKNLTEGIDK